MVWKKNIIEESKDEESYLHVNKKRKMGRETEEKDREEKSNGHLKQEDGGTEEKDTEKSNGHLK